MALTVAFAGLALLFLELDAQFAGFAQILVYIGAVAILVVFAILAGMWPFHTWAPTGHVAAPTGASMLLAGVVMKLGAYGCRCV